MNSTPSKLNQQREPPKWEKRAHTGFDRASRRRKCPICGSTKWCQVTKDGRLAHCMYVSASSVREAADGGYIHVLVDAGLARTTGEPQERAAERSVCPLAPLAPLHIRHAAYTKLIELSPAWSYEEDLVLGRGGLRSRGFPANFAARFGALPPGERRCDLLAAKVEEFIGKRFPDYAEGRTSPSVIGIPGFWRTPRGQLKLGSAGDKVRPALLVPYRSATGAIQACQFRVTTKDDKDYFWLSTSQERIEKEPDGASSGSPIHWTFPGADRPDDAPIIITEGALKAEAFAHHAPGLHVIATAGVGNSHEQILDAASGARLAVGFDRDHRENRAVCRQMARLVRGRYERRERQPTEVLVWDGPKGIDDAARAGVSVVHVAPAEWYRQLPIDSQNEVKKAWATQDELSSLIRSRQPS